ncbi:MAG TPA: type III secretion system outer membrane ring subunit SctC [Noviherbaspirillum sp.]|nr:type III secretion system outer membrane ring subunit SctC [Noviherbaspirillum sp.]
MKFLNIKRCLAVMMIGAGLLWSSSAQAATPDSWKDSGFSINASGMPLRDVMQEFGNAFGVRVSYSLKESHVLKSRLKADSGIEFLDRLTHSYKFRWFVYNGTLYIVPSNDNVSVRLEVGEDAVQDAKSALVGLGLFDNRFGWGELPDEGVVMVSGPREYINLAREILLPENRASAPKGKQLMVFRLKYASATDRVINTRGQKETIPGIKTILAGLLNPDRPAAGHGGRDDVDVSSSKRSLKGKYGRGDASESGARTAGGRLQQEIEDEDDQDARRSRRAKETQRSTGPRIDADASLNAIIIYDHASKRQMYQSLIAELDVEPQQIEIEALIVDIDRSRLAELGVEWGARNGNTNLRVNATSRDSQGDDLPIPGATLLISNAARFYARLKALEGTGEANVLAKPTVLTLDNVAAVLDLSQTSYLPLVGERVADLANVTAGTMLRVVPRIVKENTGTRVRLEVDIEDGSLGDPNQKNTVATRSTISTQAIVDLQQTLMIGGYHAESRTINKQKVPVLGDMPLLGGLFRSENEQHNNRERLFLITPRVRTAAGMPAPERSKLGGIAQGIAAAEQAMAAAVDGTGAAPAPKRKLKCARPKPGFQSALQ